MESVGSIGVIKVRGRTLCLRIGERIVQPVEKSMIKQSNEAGATLLWGSTMRKITLEFAFDVSPDDLQSPVGAILIDGDGNKHEQTVDLKGILEVR